MPTKPAPTRRSGSYQDDVSFTLSESRRVRLLGEIALHTMAHIANSLDYLMLQDKKKPIEILLNSGGGEVIQGLAIYDAIIAANKITPVNITAMGACMSMGAIILQSGRVRRAYPNTEFLLHEVSYGEFGRHSEHKDRAKQVARMQGRLDSILISRSKLTQDSLRELIERKDYHITASEALEHGLIDEIIGQ